MEYAGAQPSDPSRMRISDADRHRVAELLREAAGEGRLDLEELEERLEATYAAKTYADLVPITVDLPADPVHGPVTRPSTAPARRQVPPAAVPHQSSVAILGDCKRLGAWLVPERHTAFALMGDVTIDLREATFAAHEVLVTAIAVMSDVKIYVDQFTQVVVDGVPVMGEFGQGRDAVPAQLGPDSPVVRVKGMALMASVKVTRKPAGEQRSRWRPMRGPAS